VGVPAVKDYTTKLRKIVLVSIISLVLLGLYLNDFDKEILVIRWFVVLVNCRGFKAGWYWVGIILGGR